MHSHVMCSVYTCSNDIDVVNKKRDEESKQTFKIEKGE